ncbi:hypothetical protein CRUP_027030 [Coryphaenoides rupestris]|nr:hypothetical protein CRUP_027030 [Coryphaenoides rupestris]
MHSVAASAVHQSSSRSSSNNTNNNNNNNNILVLGSLVLLATEDEDKAVSKEGRIKDIITTAQRQRHRERVQGTWNTGEKEVGTSEESKKLSTPNNHPV